MWGRIDESTNEGIYVLLFDIAMNSLRTKSAVERSLGCFEPDELAFAVVLVGLFRPAIGSQPRLLRVKEENCA